MEQYKIDRINALSRKSKAEGLTDEEKTEQQLLRAEYVAAMRRDLEATLENTYIMESDGTKRKLKKKK
jgi:uncharacterized protein YnzC (UPF0291/DUF896 family)